MVPAWTLLAALAVGVVVGVVAARLSWRPPPPAPQSEALSTDPGTTAGPTAPEPEPAPSEPVRIGMEDVVSELERRYQGRQADKAAEKRPGGRRRRTG